MNISIGFPNLIIGLREALEAGLVITILLAAVRRGSGDRRQTAAVWLGVIAALSLSVSAAIVLTASLAAMPAAGQSVLSGLLGLLAVVLVTRMIFTMRRTARTLKGDLTAKVASGAANGTAALLLTAFAAVARESLEAMLFLWAATRQTGNGAGAMIGAAVGIGLGLLAAWLLYRRALRLDLGRFFTYTAAFLTVVIAGILAYSLGELQAAGWLPGRSWVAWDVSTTIDASSWWMAIITSVTGIAVRMTVLQIVAWTVYLVVVLWLYFRAPVAAAATSVRLSRSDAIVDRVVDRARPVAVAVIVIPLSAAVVVSTLLPKEPTTESTVTVADGQCGRDGVIDGAGGHTFSVHNTSGRAGEVTLEDAAGNILGEIETLAPATTVPMRVTVPTGRFRFHCAMAGSGAAYSEFIPVTGVAAAKAPTPKPPVSEADLAAPAEALRADVLVRLDQLRGAVTELTASLGADDSAGSRRAWRTAMLIWQQSSASYRAFGALGDAVGGEPWALPLGVHDQQFGGLRRLEYGLWHGQRPAELVPIAQRLTADVDRLAAAVRAHDPQIALDPKDIPLRAHEVLEEAERHLTNGFSDLGAGSEYAETAAMIANTRVVLDALAGLLNGRDPNLLASARGRLDHLETILRTTAQTPSGEWLSRRDLTTDQRLSINAALSSTIELLAQIPGELEPPLARSTEGK